MAQAKQGDSVTVHYTGRFADGEIFDCSETTETGEEGNPLTFTIGSGEMIPGFEQAVLGMSPGDSRTVVVPADQAYGDYEDGLVAVFQRQDLPDTIDPEVGQQLEITQEDGHSFHVLVTRVTDSEVTMDANHPLAGKELTFQIRLVTIS